MIPNQIIKQVMSGRSESPLMFSDVDPSLCATFPALFTTRRKVLEEIHDFLAVTFGPKKSEATGRIFKPLLTTGEHQKMIWQKVATT